jgi:hypothetical protein
MKTVTGRVVGNTVILDEPLPDGAIVEVVVSEWTARSPAPEYAAPMCEADEVIAFDDDTIAELRARCSEADLGAFVPVEEVLAEIRASRKVARALSCH